MTLSALGFLSRWLLDRNAGGAYGATDATGQRPLTTDKTLPDQASTVLALVDQGTDDDLQVAVAGLLRMQDTRGHPGFAEFTDRYWQPYPTGRVRTVRYQLHGAAALLAAAHRLDVDELRVRAVDLVNRCFGLVQDGRFPTRLTEDWRGIVSGPPTPQTAVSALRALAVAGAAGETSVDADALVVVAKRLTELADGARDTHPRPELRRCAAMARLALALGHAGRMLEADEYIHAAGSVLRTVRDRFLDVEQDAFWDRLTADGRVQVDWVEAPQAGHCPFPVIRAADAAQLILAGRLLSQCGIDCSEVVDPARRTVARLTDGRHGGVFLAVGFLWATPTDPVVTTPELVWPTPRQPGLLVEGGLYEVSLSQKPAHTQATAALALQTPPTDEPAPEPPIRSAPVVAGGRPRRLRGAVVDHSRQMPIDQDGYLRSLLTTRVEPWRTPAPYVGAYVPAAGRHIWPILHTAADLRLFGRDVPPALVAHVCQAQDPDGGFGEQPGRPSDLVSSYCALLVLYLAGERPTDSAGAVRYLRSCQGPDGSFGAVPGMVGDLWNTNLAVAALHTLQGAPTDAAGAVRFVLDNRDADGSYVDRAGRRANTFVLRRAVSTLLLLGQPVPDPAATIAWLQRCQLPNGGFSHRPGGALSLAGTHHAVAALAILGSEPADLAGCERWLASQQNPDGQFGCHDAPTATADGFACVQALATLRKMPGPEWTLLVG